MKVFKKLFSLWGISLCVLMFTNIITVGVICKYERKSHLLQHKLERMGIIKKEKPINEFIEHPDYWSVMGWNNTIEKLDYHCDVLFFGHSQIAGSDFRHYFPNMNIVNSGYPGDNVEGMRMRIPQIEALKPAKVFLMCGVNSLWMSDEIFNAKYDLLVKDIRRASPNSKLYIFNILPERNGSSGNVSQNPKIIERNKFIKKYTQQNNIQMIDLYSAFADETGALIKDFSIDGVHVNSKGYDKWAEVIKPFME